MHLPSRGDGNVTVTVLMNSLSSRVESLPILSGFQGTRYRRRIAPLASEFAMSDESDDLRVRLGVEGRRVTRKRRHGHGVVLDYLRHGRFRVSDFNLKFKFC